ncbi:MAG: nuclear transport factor 2 family protein [Pyrinomonadaceae bacterium]
MKANLVVAVLIVSFVSVTAQKANRANTDPEVEIQRLDNEAAKAILDKDEKLIKRYFTDNSVTNNPRSGLTFGSKGIIEASRSNLINYYSFERVIESVRVYGDTAVTMGRETVVTKDVGGGPGDTIRRRYTNIWKRTGRSWQIISRHANIICR